MLNDRFAAPLDIAIGRKVRALRLSRKLTGGRVAAAVGSTQTTVYLMEAGLVAIGRERLARMAQLFEVSVADILRPVLFGGIRCRLRRARSRGRSQSHRGRR
jgi:transcriptional regulator with XRE-family HTH domain